MSCKCSIDHSDKHPDYFESHQDQSNRDILFWGGEGDDMDPHKAEEKARLICNSSFTNILENPEHWITRIDDCFVLHRYICEDGSIKRSSGQF